MQRDLADHEFSGGLLVKKTAYDKRQHLAFARRKLEIMLLERGQVGSLRSNFPILDNRRVDRAHDVRITERFGQKIQRAMFDRAH